MNALHSLSAAARGAGIPLQFFVLGETLARHAAPIQELRRARHAIDQHTYTHLPLVSSAAVRVAGGVSLGREKQAPVITCRRVMEELWKVTV